MREQKISPEEDSDGYLEGNDGAVEPLPFDSEGSSQQVRHGPCSRKSLFVLLLTPLPLQYQQDEHDSYENDEQDEDDVDPSSRGSG